jgi:hypothetical protein
MDYNLVTYLTTPEIRDNPELTTHHLPSTRDYQFSDDTSSSGSVSADVGLEPLNNGATAGDSTYSYVDRIDGNEFGNYLIISEGTDNHDYRMLYEYVIDCLGSLEILTKNFDLALECESFLHRLDIDFSSLGGHEDIHSSTIFQAGQALLAFLSAI